MHYTDAQHVCVDGKEDSVGMTISRGTNKTKANGERGCRQRGGHIPVLRIERGGVVDEHCRGWRWSARWDI